MDPSFANYLPPVGFYFTVEMLGKNNASSPGAEASFQEVSGISVAMETEQIQEGEQNSFIHKVPGRVNYENLVLKRGMMVSTSDLAKWCQSIFQQSLNQKIEPKTIRVALLDANTEGKGALMSWVFTNAYPVKWEVASLDAQRSEIMVESITFAYSYFEKVDALSAKGHPHNP